MCLCHYHHDCSVVFQIIHISSASKLRVSIVGHRWGLRHPDRLLLARSWLSFGQLEHWSLSGIFWRRAVETRLESIGSQMFSIVWLIFRFYWFGRLVDLESSSLRHWSGRSWRRIAEGFRGADKRSRRSRAEAHVSECFFVTIWMIDCMQWKFMHWSEDISMF